MKIIRFLMAGNLKALYIKNGKRKAKMAPSKA